MSLHTVVYSPCWNEEVVLPFFLRHYGCFAQTINLLDNGSTDSSLEIIAEFRRRRPDVTVNVRSIDSDDRMRDDFLLNFKNHAWKECAGTSVDWVVIVDVDEFVQHENIGAELQRLRDERYTAILCVGYEMVGDGAPDPATAADLTKSIRRGLFSEDFSKCAVFNPNEITEIHYTIGAHVCSPKGRVKIHHDQSLKLLHYKSLGLDYVMARRRQLAERLSDVNKHYGWGVHNEQDEALQRQRFSELQREAEEIL